MTVGAANGRAGESSVERIPLVKLPNGISRRRGPPPVRKITMLIVGLVLLIFGIVVLYSESEENQLEASVVTKENIVGADEDVHDPSEISDSVKGNNELMNGEQALAINEPAEHPSFSSTDGSTSIDVSSSTTEKAENIDVRDPFDYLNDHEVIPPLELPDAALPVLLENFQKAKENLVEQLREEYGHDVADQLFFSRSIGFTSSLNLSRERFIRKIKLKLLDVQTRKIEQQKQASQHILCPTWVWATGGHSAAAGHGNYFNESYTARLERLALPLFKSVGMHFIGRNYAMGGSSSGLEIGVCVDQIFGLDIDVLSWDFAMTDGNGVGIFENYFSHAAIHPNRPLMVGLNTGGHRGPQRQAVMQHFEENGMPIMVLDDGSLVKPVTEIIPDSFGKSEEELRSLGPLVRNMKCEGKVESGDPYCGQERWSPLCPERKYKAKWHPGWKYQSFYGTLLALSLLEILEAAVQELSKSSYDNPNTLLQQLLAEEDRDYDMFMQSSLTKEAEFGILNDPLINMTLITRERPLCRTGRLPAQSRFLGIMTETEDKISYTNYEMGVWENEAKMTPNSGEQMRLVYDVPHDARNCEVPLNQDFKDYYMVTSSDGWQVLSFPNNREEEYYSSGKPRKGLIMIALAVCGWHCPEGDLRESDFTPDIIEVQVNGVEVTQVATAWAGVFLKHGANGSSVYFPANTEGRYDLRVRVHRQGAYLRISGISVW